MVKRKLTRRRFLQVSALGVVGLATGCSTDESTYSRKRNTTAGQTTQNHSLARLEENVVSGGPGKDGIPPIDEPKFVSASEMDDQLKPEDKVFVLDYKGETKVYPQPVLVWHEIVNDEVAGDKLSITYCPLTGSTVAFKGRTPAGEPLTFGTTGSLVNSNLIMYDRETGSEWSQILGRSIAGRMRGEPLQEIPLVWTTWRHWKERGTDAPYSLPTPATSAATARTLTAHIPPWTKAITKTRTLFSKCWPRATDSAPKK